MATFDWRDNIGKNLLDSGNLLGPGNSSIRDGRVRGRANTGTQRTGRQGEATDLAAGTREFVGGIAPRTPTDTGNPAARVNRALAIMDTPLQRNRASAESTANDATAEQLRLSLINQERMRKNLQGPGAMNPVEFRASLAEMQAGQAGIDSLQQAIGGAREAQVATRGQSIDSATALTDRAMAEAGAFDRSMVNLDVADIQGQYGLGREFLGQSLRNQGAIDLEQTVDPVTAERLRIGRELMTQAEASGDPALQGRVGIGMFNNLGDPAQALSVTPAADELVTFVGADGTEQTAPASVVRAVTTTRQVQQNPEAFGIYQPLTDEDVSRIAAGVSPAVIAAEQAQRMREQEEQRRMAEEARATVRRRNQANTLGPDRATATTLEREARLQGTR